ncbi:MAG: FRG domain-containing protein [bacterium]|nr:FRG domain-containing protein [bacterium]
MQLPGWYDFLDEIERAKEALGSPEHVWYRGHSNSQWLLIPPLYRDPRFLDREQLAFSEFARSASRLFEKRTNDWETLFDMQHYGLPTRLLDWSKVLGIAIAFAVLDYRDDMPYDPAIFVLDPLALNRRSGIEVIKEITDETYRYREIYWHHRPFVPNSPIALDPPLQTARMFAQQASFTVHGLDERSLEEQCANEIVKVDLSSAALPGARQFLEYANLNAYSIYPDIVGMARHLRKRVFGP